MSLWAFVCSVHLCFSVRNRTHPPYEMTHKQIAGKFFLSRWGVFSLTELTELTEPFCEQFRAHRTPPAYRVHRALLLKMAVRFCEIGWLNVSVKLCVFCSSVFSVRNRTHPLYEITHNYLCKYKEKDTNNRTFTQSFEQKWLTIYYLLVPQPAPLHSERGWGWGSLWL